MTRHLYIVSSTPCAECGPCEQTWAFAKKLLCRDHWRAALSKHRKRRAPELSVA